ncbi:succinyldiaminopimelate transaminase [Aeromicrobium wangtongii]|uniref:Succinyldiaminopimelate transaminase n=1 Tax=Aeromicrobium wangtongii TaxID=2969247 RepID=A0ABY5M8T8_9ACTN|nr:succinyldiaminopimelate transaminase [Aeromicrobium wangtongii]MCD9197049.1 succinyldiaminopimelate transaminase [Aeromicrobium wangtongii]UUP14550.1 succinyldiaminopimelate transaminase [Aeromicrobium wangtongii]
MARVSERFPEFPWDTIAGAKARAAEHPGGIVDLSIGTPVDPTPEVAREALVGAADSPGYPTVFGPESLRQAAVDWLERRFEITGLSPSQVLPTVGSKELIANLPMQLGLGAGDLVVIPELAYPTYEVGARYAGCEVLAADSTIAIGPRKPALIYLNSPANPHGRILGKDHLRKVVEFARERGALLVSDECYLEFAWDDEPFSVLHPDICGGSFDGLLAVHSLSKRSNLAGYRDAFVVGDQAVVDELLAVRKHLGFMLPTPVQAAMTAALADDTHVQEQQQVYAARRADLRAALESAGFTVEHSQGALYLWATRGEPCRDTVAWLAERGILVAPGEFYGSAGAQHVRVAFTATDDRIAAAVERLTA